MNNRGVFKLLVFGVLAGIMLNVMVGCGGGGKEGQFPNLAKGDKWTYQISYEGSYYEITYEITGEGSVSGESCWIEQISISPAYFGVSSATDRFSRTTGAILQMQASVTYMGIPASVSDVYSYTPSDASEFPLEVGKQVNRTETKTETITVPGEDPQIETTTTAHTFKVEKVEDVTVQAGTFKCFKVTDATDDGTDTMWYSDKVKNSVKEVDADGTTRELTSYSV